MGSIPAGVASLWVGAIRFAATRSAVDPSAAMRWWGLGGATLICAAIALQGTALPAVPGPAVMAAILLAAMISSIAGFAFSAICGAMLFHLVADPVQVVQIMIVCSIANQAAMTWSLRHTVNWTGLSVFLTGGAIGLPAGVWLLIHADRAAYTLALGVFLVGYGLLMLLRRPVIVRWRNPLLDLGVGVLGGITGGAAGFPGAAVTIWCSVKGWDKSRQRAQVQPFILLMQVAALLAISLANGQARPTRLDPADLLFIPASLLGTALGMGLFRRLSDRQFARVVNLLLVLSGISYIV